MWSEKSAEASLAKGLRVKRERKVAREETRDMMSKYKMAVTVVVGVAATAVVEAELGRDAEEMAVAVEAEAEWSRWSSVVRWSRSSR